MLADSRYFTRFDHGSSPGTSSTTTSKDEVSAIATEYRSIANACVHLGGEQVGLRQCSTCGGNVRLKEYPCALGLGVDGRAVPSQDCGAGRCPSYQKQMEPTPPSPPGKPEPIPISSPETNGEVAEVDRSGWYDRTKVKWSYGLITVPERRDTLLPRTLASLADAGFPRPRLFVDGARNREASWWEDSYGCEVTARWPRAKVNLNWFWALHEVYGRDPDADRYAIFQDDFVTYPHLREYLEWCGCPDDGYLNLYTFPSNQDICPTDLTRSRNQKVGWYSSNQYGRGAVALVFPKPAAVKLLTSHHMVTRCEDKQRGWRVVDGGILEAMKKAGVKEYVHNPSLVYHTGEVSTVAPGTKRPKGWETPSWRGETFDALRLKNEAEMTFRPGSPRPG